MWNFLTLIYRTRIGLAANHAIAMAVLLASSGRLMAVDYAALVRKLSRMPDDVPVARIDDVIANKRTAEAGADLLRRKAKDGGNLADLPAVRKRALQEAANGLDSATIRQLDTLPADAQDAVFLVSAGARKMRETIPDIALRGDFLRDGGADVLAMLGRRGDYAGDALEFRNYLKTGKLPSPPGERAITLGDLARFMDSNPSRSDYFWRTYWKGKEIYWLGTAGLAAVLLAPDEYLDAAGHLVQKGVDKLAGIMGKGIEEIVRGGTMIIQKPVEGLFKALFSSPWSLALLAVVCGAGFLYVASWRKFLRRLVAGTAPAQQPDTTNQNPK